MIRINIFKKFFFVKFLFLLVIIFCINLFLRKTAPIPYAALLNYNQLYYDKDKIHIENISIANDSLEINFEGNDLYQQKNNFQVFSGGTLIYKRDVVGKKLRFKPHEAGKNTISISVNGPADTISMCIDYSPDSVYRKYGNSSDILYEVTTDNLTGAVPLYSFKDWELSYRDDDTVQFAKETELILKDSVKIQKNDNSQQKVLKLAGYILTRTAGSLGIPTDTLSALHPLRQLSYVQAGKSKIWCGNFSSIFAFLASSAGLPVRLVSCGQSDNRHSNGVHVFCEVFMREDQSWAYVDLTSGNILVRYNKKWLNTIDIQRLLRYPVQDTNFVAYHYEKDSLYEIPFFKVADLATHYFHSSNTFIFYYGNFLKIMTPKNLLARVIKFFYTKPYYAVYSDNLSVTNYSFYLRIITNYLLVLLLLIYLEKIAKKMYKFRRQE